MSNPEDGVENNTRRGREVYDCMFRLRATRLIVPLIDMMMDTCKALYYPQKKSFQTHIAMIKYMKCKPTKWGFKMFALKFSSNCYTVDFTVCMAKMKIPPRLRIRI